MGKPRARVTFNKKGRGAQRPSSPRDGLLPMTSEDLLRHRPRKVEPFTPRTYAQHRYAHAIATQTLTFGVGPAGTGKTFVAASLAAEALVEGRVEKVIICRPICEAGEKIGYLPGDMAEKTDPYMAPLVEVLNRRLGRSYTEALVKAGKIEVLPLAFMRGRSLELCFIILDEAQNTTPVQMKLFLTRIGEDAVVVVNGDLTQRDIPGPSGLADALDRVRHIPSVAIVRFTRADIVRSGICQAIVEAYEVPSEEVPSEEVGEPVAGLHRAIAF